MPWEVISQFFFKLPPFRASDTYQDGELLGSTICVPYSIDSMAQLYQRRGARAAQVFANERVCDATWWAYDRFGITTFGLGETMAAATARGSSIKKMFKERGVSDVQKVKTTTGHVGTIMAMYLNLREVRKIRSDLGEDTPLGVIGLGSIGSTFIRLLLSQEGPLPSEIWLFDVNGERTGKISKLIRASNYSGKVIAAKSPIQVIQETGISVAATTSPGPLIDFELVQHCVAPNMEYKRHVVIDDSQPPYVAEMPGDSPVLSVWPVYPLPKGYVRFHAFSGKADDYGKRGLTFDTAWGCETESFLVHRGLIPPNRKKPTLDELLQIKSWVQEEYGEDYVFPLISYGRKIAAKELATQVR